MVLAPPEHFQEKWEPVFRFENATQRIRDRLGLVEGGVGDGEAIARRQIAVRVVAEGRADQATRDETSRCRLNAFCYPDSYRAISAPFQNFLTQKLIKFFM
jgi:hypothetical protein